MFSKLLLGKSERFEDFGAPQVFPALSLLVAWIIVGACIFRGVKSSGKVAYFTAIFPYLVLLVLIIQSALLKGSIDGIKYYIIPRWDLVAKFEVENVRNRTYLFFLRFRLGKQLLLKCFSHLVLALVHSWPIQHRINSTTISSSS